MKCSTEWLSYGCKHNEMYMPINHCTFLYIDKVQKLHISQEEEMHMTYHLYLKPKHAEVNPSLKSFPFSFVSKEKEHAY